MTFTPVWVQGSFNWLGLAIGLVLLAMGWTILRLVLRLTMKMFALGCTGLLVVVGIVFVLMHGK